uniref:Uncharacterized protein n=1 Tax=Physcomitrium patens TaxID=3218 RepID=A0A2K1IUM9_PHYPA|nr:hypothetical protein PHYPA_024927 [Physcomitrium patens]
MSGIFTSASPVLGASEGNPKTEES